VDTLRVIDADTHVLETEDTWNFLEPNEQGWRPEAEAPKNPDPNRRPVKYWNFSGRRRPRPITDDATAGTSAETRELLDVEARVRHMDELGIDTHVVYPTVFLTEPALDAEHELAWDRSYNRWMAERTERSNGRLRWIYIPSLRNMDEAVKELRWASQHGACGVLKKGDEEAGHWPAEEYFFPLYEEAERLNMPICFHLGSGIPDFMPGKVFEAARLMRTRLPVLHAIHSLVYCSVTAKFPKLRWGAVECGAGWAPWVEWDLRRRANLNHFNVGENMFQANNIYVTVQPDEDLPHIVKTVGTDNLLSGSDYAHVDPSTEIGHVQALQDLADRGDITHETVRKIVHDNPKTFYGL
jgi:predicted TIM-barrel fold metal-dependent hydrolase